MCTNPPVDAVPGWATSPTVRVGTSKTNRSALPSGREKGSSGLPNPKRAGSPRNTTAVPSSLTTARSRWLKPTSSVGCSVSTGSPSGVRVTRMFSPVSKSWNHAPESLRSPIVSRTSPAPLRASAMPDSDSGPGRSMGPMSAAIESPRRTHTAGVGPHRWDASRGMTAHVRPSPARAIAWKDDPTGLRSLLKKTGSIRPARHV